MKRKTVFLIIVVVVFVGILLCVHYFPLWVSVTNVIVSVAGVFVGWMARVLYNKYIVDDLPKK